jgi:hypothetical protein
MFNNTTKKLISIFLLGMFVFLMFSCCADAFTSHSMASADHMADDGCVSISMGSMGHKTSCGSSIAAGVIKLSPATFISISLLSLITLFVLILLEPACRRDIKNQGIAQFWRDHLGFYFWTDLFRLGTVHPKVY